MSKLNSLYERPYEKFLKTLVNTRKEIQAPERFQVTELGIINTNLRENNSHTGSAFDLLMISL